MLSHLTNCFNFNVSFVISYIMERIDLVMFGAEGVVESGGIINKVSFDAFRKSVYRRHSNTSEFIRMYTQ